MVLHISVDGVNSERLTSDLFEYYKSKGYKTGLRRRPDCKQIHEIKRFYNLLNHEKALLNAFDESLSYFMADWEKYDIVFWQNSILTDYLELMNKTVTPFWLKQINKTLPDKDLYLYINSQKNPKNLTTIKNFKDLIILNKSESTTTDLNNAVTEINNYFPHCYWCNHIYRRDKNHIKYCSKTCSSLANQKQIRDRVNKYNRLHRKSNASNYNSNMGSNALLKQHPNTDFEKEHKLIINEKRRQGIL